jgi:hypothetical protein
MDFQPAPSPGAPSHRSGLRLRTGALEKWPDKRWLPSPHRRSASTSARSCARRAASADAGPAGPSCRALAPGRRARQAAPRPNEIRAGRRAPSAFNNVERIVAARSGNGRVPVSCATVLQNAPYVACLLICQEGRQHQGLLRRLREACTPGRGHHRLRWRLRSERSSRSGGIATAKPCPAVKRRYHSASLPELRLVPGLIQLARIAGGVCQNPHAGSSAGRTTDLELRARVHEAGPVHRIGVGPVPRVGARPKVHGGFVGCQACSARVLVAALEPSREV